MGVLTVRGIDDKVSKALKERARKEGTNVNSVLLKVLKEAMSLKKKRRNIVYNDLDDLAGTWSKKDYSEFQNRVVDFETIDKHMWK